MAIRTGNISIASNDPRSPLGLGLLANRGYYNTEQSCPEGFTGTAVPAGTYFADTQVAADALAAADLVCVADEFGGAINGIVFALGVLDDDSIVAGGSFSLSGGSSVANLTKLDAGGTVIASFAPSVSGAVYSVDVDASDNIVFGGDFTSVGGSSAVRLARCTPAGSIDAAFAPNINGRVRTICILANGKVAIGGSFSEVNGTARNSIALLNSNGSLDSSWNPAPDGIVEDIYEDVDTGLIYVCGWFANIAGSARRRAAVLNADGSLYTTFADPAIAWPGFTPIAMSIVPQSTGKVLVSGTFTQSGGYAGTNNLTRLNANGTLDLSWTLTAPDTGGTRILLDDDDKFYVIGSHVNIGGFGRTKISRVLSGGGVDAAFANVSANSGSVIYGAVFQSSGKIVAGGNFTTIAGASRSNIARLNADGTIA
jgi:uncharacterized delta-60 repeat protein